MIFNSIDKIEKYFICIAKIFDLFLDNFNYEDFIYIFFKYSFLKYYFELIYLNFINIKAIGKYFFYNIMLENKIYFQYYTNKIYRIQIVNKKWIFGF